MDNWKNNKGYKKDVYLLPKFSDDKDCQVVLCFNEIEKNILEDMPNIKVENIMPHIDHFLFPDGHGVTVFDVGLASSSIR